MTDVMKESFLSLKEPVNTFGHGVKLPRELTDFIVFVPDFIGNADVKDTLRGFLHGPLQFFDRTRRCPRDAAGNKHGNQSRYQSPAPPRHFPHDESDGARRNIGAYGKETVALERPHVSAVSPHRINAFLGTGMCLSMGILGDGSAVIMGCGIALGILGIAGVGMNYPIYKKLLNAGKEKYAFEILQLAREISESAE